jgi:hypothetical protein
MLRYQKPAALICGVPVALPDTLRKLQEKADRLCA